MCFTFITIFENLIKPYFKESLLKRAIEAGLIKTSFLNVRDFSKDKHKKVDDYKLGGGAGLLMSAQPLFDTLKAFKKEHSNAHIVFLSPVGKPFKQIDAKRLAQKEHIAFVCGRYEGIDERVIEIFADEIFSVGDFILMGAELPALTLCEAIARNIKGVLGNEESLSEESFEEYLLEAPAFAKPLALEQNFNQKKQIFYANSVFLKGNHAKIKAFKFKLALCKTQFFRPDLYARCKIKDKK